MHFSLLYQCNIFRWFDQCIKDDLSDGVDDSDPDDHTRCLHGRHVLVLLDSLNFTDDGGKRVNHVTDVVSKVDEFTIFNGVVDIVLLGIEVLREPDLLVVIQVVF